MTGISTGDMALAVQQRRDMAALKTETRRLTQELLSGRVSDIARTLRGNLASLAGIELTIARANGFRAATDEAALVVQGMQMVLERIDSSASEMVAPWLMASQSGSAMLLDTTGREAAAQFASAARALNTQLGGRTLFAGVQSDGPAMADPETILDALAAAAAGATSAADVEATIRAWFDAPGGFAAQAYLGGEALAAMPVSPDDRVDMGVTAADPALRDTLAGLAMAAMLDRGLPPGPLSERADLARRAGEALLQGSEARLNLAARIGAAEARIASAAQRNASEAMALGIARDGLLEADGLETASRLEAAQTRLETLFAVTARLSRLSLVDYLR